MCWQCAGNVLAMCWQCAGNVQAMCLALRNEREGLGAACEGGGGPGYSLRGKEEEEEEGGLQPEPPASACRRWVRLVLCPGHSSSR